MPECCYSGPVSDEVAKSSASVMQPNMETCCEALWETPGSLVYNEVNESDWKDRQVRPLQDVEQVSVRV